MLLQALILCFLYALQPAEGAGFSKKSSIQCQGASYATRACVLQNVVIWRGVIYAISSEPLEIPSVRLDTFHNPVANEDELQLKDLVRVFPPSRLPFADDAVISKFAAGGAFKRMHIHNWFHTLTEDAANWAVRICKHLGLCEFDDFHGTGKDFLLVFLDAHGPARGNFGDIHNCWGRSVSLDETPDNEALVVERLLVGVGDECNPPHCFLPENNQMQPLTKASTQAWIRFMRECAGLPAQPPLRTTSPRVAFVDRAHNAGRNILTVGQVFAHFNNDKQKKKYHNATFELQYMEGLHWKDSAAIFADSDIVITPHGAQMCNLIFQPMQSEFLHVSSFQGHYDLNRWVAQNAALYNSLGEDGILWPQGNAVDLQKVIASYGGVDAWTKEDLLSVLETEHCPETFPHPHCKDLNLFSRHLHYNPAKQLLVNKVEEALHRWHRHRSNQAAESLITIE